jgi:peptidoglycan L-alanyl-D-glutamate endopeptidase CwlK
MSTFRFGLRSQSNLVGVHPDLASVAIKALEYSAVDFSITEGLRSKARQQQLFNERKSMTLNSRHIDGHAIDVAAIIDGQVNWHWAHYEAIAVAFDKASKELSVPVEWGGNWAHFKDGPHFQLPYSRYPSAKDATAGVQA